MNNDDLLSDVNDGALGYGHSLKVCIYFYVYLCKVCGDDRMKIGQSKKAKIRLSLYNACTAHYFPPTHLSLN